MVPYCQNLNSLPILLAQSFYVTMGRISKIKRQRTEAARISSAKGATATKARWERLKNRNMKNLRI